MKTRLHGLCLGLSLVVSACALDGQGQEGETVSDALRTVDDPLYNPKEPIPGLPRPPPPPQGPGVVPGEFSSVEDVPLWLIELEVKTADVEDAGTDDRVTLRMKLRDGGTVDLNLGGDDRERGDTQRYIVNPWAVKKIRDIEQLEIYKNGDDGWAITSVALRVNNDAAPIFSHPFAAPLWLDSASGHARNVVFAGTQLRAHAGWSLAGRTAMLEPPANIDATLLQRMIEGAMGDALEEVPRIDFGTKYGPSYVEVARTSASVTDVDLDLDDDNGIFRALEIDTNFTITWTCRDGNIDFDLSRFTMPDVPADWGFALMHKGRFFRHVEDMLLRLRALTQNRPYRCSAAPVVRTDGGITTNIVRRPTLPPAVAGTVFGGLNDAVLAGDFTSVFTVAPSIEDVPVWSLHLETETANVEDAGTDDTVDLNLTDTEAYYRLARNADNRERGAVERYQVTIPGIHRVRDITRIDLRLPEREDDGWCVQRVALFVNDEPTPLFEQRFAQCKWVDTDGTDQTPLTISSSQLRADSRWSLTGRPNIRTPRPTQMSASFLRSRLESPLHAVFPFSGTKLRDCDNLRCIQIERGSGRSVEVDVRYTRVMDWASDANMHMNFDLGFRCVNGRLESDMRNYVQEGSDTTMASTRLLDAFADYFENMTLERRCTADPQVVDYGTTLFSIAAQ